MAKNTPELIDIGDDISLRIVRWGNPEVLNGRPILVVHGLASNALLWKSSALALVNLGHPVIGVDLRGHGPFSSKPDDEYDVVTVTNDISRLLLVLKEKEDFKKPIVLTSSFSTINILNVNIHNEDIHNEDIHND
jgi:pimeloyl-ACP methyl ester carboxylesterase